MVYADLSYSSVPSYKARNDTTNINGLISFYNSYDGTYHNVITNISSKTITLENSGNETILAPSQSYTTTNTSGTFGISF